MLSLTKKSDAQPVAAPLWHTNFRNFERLPDTKVVRTTFFINTAAIAVVVGMLLWVGYREYTNHNIQEQIAEAQRQIDGNKKQNAEAIRLSKTFAEEQKRLEDVAAFTKGPITILEFIDVIGQTMPKEIIIDNLDARLGDPRNAGFLLRGRIAGNPDQASGLVSNYVDMLRAQPRLAAVFDPITLNRIDRNPEGTFLTFDISMNIKK
ncbi:MAG: hypothetical protein WDM96_11255 [Lacunisphaera sp.]